MPPKTKVVKTVVTAPKKRKTRKSKPNKTNGKRVRRRRKTGKRNAGMLGQYAKCLSSPFMYPPVRAGYDTFVATGLATAYLRGTITMGTGGNLAILVNPVMANMLMYSGAATDATSLNGSWNISSAQNITPIKNQYDQMRVLGGGVRIHPLVAATDKPGIMQSGLMPRCSIAEFMSLVPASSVNSLAGLPFLQTHAKTAIVDGVEVAWRPTDNSDFEMKEFDSAWAAQTAGVMNASGNVGSQVYDDTLSSTLVCNLSGFAASSKVYIEIIFHYECTTSVGTLSTITQDSSQQTLADQTSIPNFQSAFRTIANSLPPLTTVLTGLASFATIGVERAARGNPFAPNNGRLWMPD